MIGDLVHQLRIVRDEQHGALKLGERAYERVAGVHVEVVGRLVEDQELRRVASGEREQEPGTLATGKAGDRRLRPVRVEAEAGELAAHLRGRRAREGAGHVIHRGFGGIQLLRLVLREVADAETRRAAHLAGQWCKAPGEQFGEGALAVAVGAQKRHAVVRLQAQVQPTQHRAAVIAGGNLVERQDRGREGFRLGKVEARGRVLDDALDCWQPLQRLEPALRLPGLGRLGTEAVHERLHMRPLRRDPLRGASLLQGLLRADAYELRVAARRQADAARIEVGDAVHGAVEQAAVVAHEQAGSWEPSEPAFEPDRRLQVEVVGRLVEQEQVRSGEQCRGQGHAHPPAARELLHGPRLRLGREAQPGEDAGRARGGAICLDGAQALVDRAQALGLAALGLGEQGHALRVGCEHRVEQRRRPGGRLLGDGREPGASREADRAAIGLDVADDGAQQRALARAVAPDETDAPPWVHTKVRAVEQRPPGHAQREVLNGEQAHAGRCSG